MKAAVMASQNHQSLSNADLISSYSCDDSYVFVIQLDLESVLELGFWRWQNIVVACNPDIERRQQKDAHDQISNESTDDDNREGPLRIRADSVRHGCRQQTKSSHQHGHHDGA